MQNQSPLPIVTIIKASYRDFFDQIKSHVILSYLISLPFFLAKILGWINLPAILSQNAQGIFTLPLIIYMIASLLLFALMVIFYFRLYSLERYNFLKINLHNLADIYGNTLMYGIMAAGLLIIATICLTLMGGLLASIITNILSLGGDQLAVVNSMWMIVMMIMVLILIFTISLRLQPTFISIAQGQRSLPFKTSWFHTTGHSRDIFLISAAVLILPYIASYIAQYIVIHMTGMPYVKGEILEFSIVSQILFYLLSPISLASVALLCAASCNIRNHLFAEEKS